MALAMIASQEKATLELPTRKFCQISNPITLPFIFRESATRRDGNISEKCSYVSKNIQSPVDSGKSSENKESKSTAEDEACRFLCSILDEVERQVDRTSISRHANLEWAAVDTTSNRNQRQVHFSSPLVTEAYSQCKDDEQTQDTFPFIDEKEDFELTPDEDIAKTIFGRNEVFSTQTSTTDMKPKALFPEINLGTLLGDQGEDECIIEREWKELEVSQVVPGTVINGPGNCSGNKTADLSNDVPCLQTDIAGVETSSHSEDQHFVKEKVEVVKKLDFIEKPSKLPIPIHNKGGSENDSAWHEEVVQRKYKEKDSFSVGQLKSQLMQNPPDIVEQDAENFRQCSRNPLIIPQMEDQTVPESRTALGSLRALSSSIPNVISNLELRCYAINSSPPLPTKSVEDFTIEATESKDDVVVDDVIPICSQNSTPEEDMLSEDDQSDKFSSLKIETISSNVGDESQSNNQADELNTTVSENVKNKMSYPGKRKAVESLSDILAMNIDAKHRNQDGKTVSTLSMIQDSGNMIDEQDMKEKDTSSEEDFHEKEENAFPPAKVFVGQLPRKIEKSAALLNEKECFGSFDDGTMVDPLRSKAKEFASKGFNRSEESRTNGVAGKVPTEEISEGLSLAVMPGLDACLDKLIDERINNVSIFQEMQDNLKTEAKGTNNDNDEVDGNCQQNPGTKSDNLAADIKKSTCEKCEFVDQETAAMVCRDKCNEEVSEERVDLKLQETKTLESETRQHDGTVVLHRGINNNVKLLVGEDILDTTDRNNMLIDEGKSILTRGMLKKAPRDVALQEDEEKRAESDCQYSEETNRVSLETPARDEEKEEEEEESVANSEGFEIALVPDFSTVTKPEESINNSFQKQIAKLTCGGFISRPHTNTASNANEMASMFCNAVRAKLAFDTDSEEDQTLGRADVETMVTDIRFYEDEKSYFAPSRKRSGQVVCIKVEEKENSSCAKKSCDECKKKATKLDLKSCLSSVFPWVEKQKLDGFEENSIEKSSPRSGTTKQETMVSKKSPGHSSMLDGAHCPLRIGLSKRKPLKKLHPYLDKNQVNMYKEDRQVVPDINLDEEQIV